MIKIKSLLIKHKNSIIITILLIMLLGNEITQWLYINENISDISYQQDDIERNSDDIIYNESRISDLEY